MLWSLRAADSTGSPVNLWGDVEVVGFSGEPTTEKQLATALKIELTPTLLLLEQPLRKDCDELRAVALRRESVVYSLTAFGAAIVDTGSQELIQTPDGRDLPARDWAAELRIQYTPSLVFFDSGGREVFRTEGWLKPFHIHGAMASVLALPEWPQVPVAGATAADRNPAKSGTSLGACPGCTRAAISSPRVARRRLRRPTG